MTTHRDNDEGRPVPPPDPVQRWVDLAIITPEQAAAIRADLARHPPEANTLPDAPDARAGAAPDTRPGTPPPTRPDTPAPSPTGSSSGGHGSLVAEALGYFGGAIIVVALGLVAGRYWPDLSTGYRLALAAVAAAGGVAAGLAVPLAAGPAAVRLRSVLWLVTAVLGAGFLAVLSGDVIGWQNEAQAFAVSAGTAVLSGLLWWWHRAFLQHLATLVAAVLTATAGVALLPGSSATPLVAAWAVGIAWYLLGWGGVIEARRQAELLGALAVAAGTASFAAEPWGSPLALLTLAVMAVLAVRVRDLPLLSITAVASLVTLPVIVTRYFHGLLPAAAVLLVVGALLVLAALVTIRHRGAEAARGEAAGADPVAGTRWVTGTTGQAWAGAGFVVGVTGVVLMVTTLI